MALTFGKLEENNYKNEIPLELIEYLEQLQECIKKGLSAGLNSAAKLGYAQLIDDFMSYCDLEQVHGKYRLTPILRAAQNGHLEVLKILHNKGARMDAKTLKGCSVMMMATMNGQSKICKHIINNFTIDAEEINESFMLALETGRPSICKLFLNAHANVNFLNEDGDIKKTPTELIKYLQYLKKCSEDSLALNKAVKLGYTELIQDFIDMGGNIEKTTEDDTPTPLLLATGKGHLEIVKILLKNGANKHAVNASRFTVLIMAAANANYDVCEYFCHDNEININDQCEDGFTAFMSAARRGHLSICELLLKHNARIDLVDSDGKDAFQHTIDRYEYAKTAAKRKEYEKIMLLLLEKKYKSTLHTSDFAKASTDRSTGSPFASPFD